MPTFHRYFMLCSAVQIKISTLLNKQVLCFCSFPVVEKNGDKSFESSSVPRIPLFVANSQCYTAAAIYCTVADFETFFREFNVVT